MGQPRTVAAFPSGQELPEVRDESEDAGDPIGITQDVE